MKGPISTFYLLDTQEALDISNKVFRIQLGYILNTLQENKRLQPVLDNNEGFNIIFDKNINDNPRIRFWLTCTKEVIKSLNSVGIEYPTVSGMLTVVAPASMAAPRILYKYPRSVRVASIGENSTSSQYFLACSTAFTATPNTSSGLLRS